MKKARTARPDWASIDTVLLDMDGTLLDRHFDDHFWLEHVPRRYAEARGISRVEAKEELLRRYRAEEGNLAWYDVDFWSGELGLDIMALKKQVEHLIAVHSHVVDFLERLRDGGKRVYLVTNAHGRTLSLKMEKTALAHRFDAVVSAHDLGLPKEMVPFWGKLRDHINFDPERTLLADDTVPVLEAAEAYGIRWIVHVARPSSALPSSRSGRYFSVDTFDEIMPSSTRPGNRA